jgi:astacin
VNSQLGTTYLRTPKGAIKQVTYSATGGFALLEGDIIIGTVEEAQAALAAGPGSNRILGVGASDPKRRWPNGVIPYLIADNVPDKSRVREAIAHWEQHTPIRFVVHTTETNVVMFQRTDANCWSEVGRQSRPQSIFISDFCRVGEVIHEIGHTVGLYHEQSREDRDKFVEILWNNIPEQRQYNFNQKINDSDDLGPYDYGSIMHYGAREFSGNGRTTIKAPKPIGQRKGLSPGDIQAVKAMYAPGPNEQ